MTKKVIIHFELDLYKLMIKKLPIILPGIRGNSSKNRRIRNKILGNNLNNIIKLSMENFEEGPK